MMADNSYAAAIRIADRAEERFQSRARRVFADTDRMFGWLMLGQWAFAIFLALFFAPYGWIGKRQVVNVHVPIAVFLGGALSSLPVYLAFRHPAAPLTRHVIAAAQMLGRHC
jgi:hypothetical protein